MWQTETSIEIAAEAETVYSYLADLRRHSEWSTGVADIEQTTGQGAEVGAEFRSEESVPMKFVSYSRITALEPPSRVEWCSWDGRTFRVEWAFELNGRGDTTVVVQRASFQPQNLLGRVLFRTMRKRQIPKENARSLASLKALLEA